MDYYERLGLSHKRHDKSLSVEGVKHAYKRALLSHHPDKQSSRPAQANSGNLTIDDLTIAYKTLSDPSLRAQYDHGVLLEQKSGSGVSELGRHTGIETVDLEELDVDNETGVWSKSCRCGSKPAYIVTEAELEKNVEFGELIIGCKGCSLWLKVMFSVDE